MENENGILGYIKCNTCNEPKAIKQGKGKRAKFVHARCSCGPDTRTGVQAQAELNAFKPLAEIQAEIAQQNKPVDKPNIVENKPNVKPIDEPQKPTEKPVKKTGEMNAATSMGVGVVVGLLFGGLIKIIKVAA